MNNFTVLMELVSVGGFLTNAVQNRATVYQGDSFKLRFLFRDTFGRNTSIAGYAITITLGGEAFTGTVTASASGVFELDVTAAQSAAIPIGIHDLRITLTNGANTTRVIQKNAVELKAS